MVDLPLSFALVISVGLSLLLDGIQTLHIGFTLALTIGIEIESVSYIKLYASMASVPCQLSLLVNPQRHPQHDELNNSY